MSEDISVAAAVRLELAAMPADLAQSAVAASALVLARELDSANNSATSKSMCAARLLEAMDQLRALMPKKEEEDEVERARKRRSERLAGQSAAGSSSSS